MPRRTGELAGSFVQRINPDKGFGVSGLPLFRARFTEFGTRGRPGLHIVSDSLAEATRNVDRSIAARIRSAIG